jgi:transketolase C-terminal domain/subunit
LRFLLSILEIAILGQMVEEEHADRVREREILPRALKVAEPIYLRTGDPELATRQWIQRNRSQVSLET